MTKYIDIKEFREAGYLQELNRQFLHPLGLALEVVQETDGTESIGGIWDYREDAEGMYYDLKNSADARIEKFSDNLLFIEREKFKRKNAREKLFGETVEPVPLSNKDKRQIMIDRTEGTI